MRAAQPVTIDLHSGFPRPADHSWRAQLTVASTQSLARSPRVAQLVLYLETIAVASRRMFSNSLVIR